jgi:hypothetical protein
MVAAASGVGAAARWLLLFHQIPPAPAYLRVKVGRRLARIGALTLKNTVYVLPYSDGTLEDFQWVLREVVASGGDATLVEARFVEGLDDGEVERRFQEQRDEDYSALADDVRAVLEGTPRVVHLEDSGRTRLEADIARFERRLEELATVDFFHAPGRDAPVGLLSELRSRLKAATKTKKPGTDEASADPLAAVQGKMWVTRAGVHVDRIASAWLVRRFVDPQAPFKFVPAKGYRPGPEDIRFDMFDAEFTHEGELCTFEVLLRRLRIDEPGLRELAEIIHDIDLKDARYERAETAGVAAHIGGLCMTERSDEQRLEQGFVLFDQLRAFFARKRKPESDG